MEDYAKTDLYNGVLTNPHLDGVIVRDFAFLDNPTRVTRGLLDQIAI